MCFNAIKLRIGVGQNNFKLDVHSAWFSPLTEQRWHHCDVHLKCTSDSSSSAESSNIHIETYVIFQNLINGSRWLLNISPQTLPQNETLMLLVTQIAQCVAIKDKIFILY